jgi:hypothetical protein
VVVSFRPLDYVSIIKCVGILTLLISCLDAQRITTLINPLLNHIRANVLDGESLARSCFVAQSHGIFSPERVHFFGEFCINARAGTSVVMTRYKTVSEETFTSIRKTNAYRAVVLGYDALKMLYTSEKVVLKAGTMT